QDEVDQLTKEIDRIAETTEFNGMKLIDGSFNDRGYTNDPVVTVMDYSEKTTAGKYAMNLVKSGDTYVLSDASFLPDGYKTASDLFGTVDPAELTIRTETVTYEDDTYTDYVTIKGREGSELRLKVDGSITENPLELDLTGLGSMRLQVGTEEGEVISASLPRMTTDAMSLAGIDMTTKEGSQKAIDQVNSALEYVNRARSRIGAYENRLENTESFLDAYNENVTASVSRIQDTDMAEEMTEYSSMQILSQAGISMLSQANEAPQQALQLLQ
nr:hypothetical protein [Lachnospiraceae bacterium]